VGCRQGERKQHNIKTTKSQNLIVSTYSREKNICERIFKKMGASLNAPISSACYSQLGLGENYI
jgi:hypothetical protein